jgi:hypothetical protein
MSGIGRGFAVADIAGCLPAISWRAFSRHYYLLLRARFHPVGAAAAATTTDDDDDDNIRPWSKGGS